jgi:hypothetical protein
MKLDFSQAVGYLQGVINKWNSSMESNDFEPFLFIKAYKRLNRQSLKKHLQEKYQMRLDEMRKNDEAYLIEEKNWKRVDRSKHKMKGFNNPQTNNNDSDDNNGKVNDGKSIITSSNPSKIIVDNYKNIHRKGFDSRKQQTVEYKTKEFVSTSEVISINSKNIFCELEIVDEPMNFSDEIYHVAEYEYIKGPFKLKRSYDFIDEPIDDILCDFKECERNCTIIDVTLERKKLIEERDLLRTCIDKMAIMKNRIETLKLTNMTVKDIINKDVNTQTTTQKEDRESNESDDEVDDAFNTKDDNHECDEYEDDNEYDDYDDS